MSKQFPAGRRDNLSGRAAASLTAKPLRTLDRTGEIELARYGARYVIIVMAVVWSSHTTLDAAEAEIADMTRRTSLAA